MTGVLSTAALDDLVLVQRARGAPGMVGRDLAKSVMPREPFPWSEGVVSPLAQYLPHRDVGRHVVAIDYGMKWNILRCLTQVGCAVTVVPGTATADEVLSHKPDGIFLSNGPGDPEPRALLVVSALTGITFYQILFMEGLERTTAFSSNVMQGSEPLFALVLLWATGSAVLARQWAGVVLALIGAAIFFLEGSGAHLGIVLGPGDVLNLTSAVSFAVYGLASGPLFDRYPGRTLMALTMGLGTLPLCLWSWLRVERVSWSALTPGAWGAVVYWLLRKPAATPMPTSQATRSRAMASTARSLRRSSKDTTTCSSPWRPIPSPRPSQKAACLLRRSVHARHMRNSVL
jgi:hypothetical protein